MSEARRRETFSSERPGSHTKLLLASSSLDLLTSDSPSLQQTYSSSSSSPSSSISSCVVLLTFLLSCPFSLSRGTRRGCLRFPVTGRKAAAVVVVQHTRVCVQFLASCVRTAEDVGGIGKFFIILPPDQSLSHLQSRLFFALPFGAKTCEAEGPSITAPAKFKGLDGRGGKKGGGFFFFLDGKKRSGGKDSEFKSTV